MMCKDAVSFLSTGIQWDHINKVRRYPNPGALQVADLPGLLLQDVFGHSVAGGHTRPHLPPCAAQLYRSVISRTFEGKHVKHMVQAQI